MTRRGFIETDPRFHARWVLPGYDADDPDVPPNKVVFDSDAAATMAYLAEGSHTVTRPTNSLTHYIDNEIVATWDYPFVPFCIFWSRTISPTDPPQPWRFTWQDWGAGGGVHVSTTGIKIMAANPGFTIGPAQQWQIRWVAFKLAAT